jgi:hypothetical protein
MTAVEPATLTESLFMKISNEISPGICILQLKISHEDLRQEVINNQVVKSFSCNV